MMICDGESHPLSRRSKNLMHCLHSDGHAASHHNKIDCHAKLLAFYRILEKKLMDKPVVVMQVSSKTK